MRICWYCPASIPSQTLSCPRSFTIVCSIACTFAEPFAHTGTALVRSHHSGRRYACCCQGCSCCVLLLCILVKVRSQLFGLKNATYQPDADGLRDCAHSWLPLVSRTLVKQCYCARVLLSSFIVQGSLSMKSVIRTVERLHLGSMRHCYVANAYLVHAPDARYGCPRVGGDDGFCNALTSCSTGCSAVVRSDI